MRVLIVGCGYMGLPLGAELVRAGHEVHGLRRSREAEAILREVGIKPLIADVTDRASLSQLKPEFDWVVNCVASGGAENYREVYLNGTRNLLDWLKSERSQLFSDSSRRDGGTPSFVYTSSTSVYGQNDGSLVTEESATEPTTDTGKILLETERLLLAVHNESGFPAIILRLAGIYGPGRGYWLKQFVSGKAQLDGDGSRVLNMIHRDDVVGIIKSALESGQPGAIYNGVDDEPVQQVELFRWLSEKLGKPMPSAVVEDDSGRKRGATSKRISNLKLRERLGYSFRFPTFREGFTCELERSSG